MISPKLQRLRFRDLLLYDAAGLAATLVFAFITVKTYFVNFILLVYPLIMLWLIRRKLARLDITPREFIGCRPESKTAWAELLAISVFTFAAYICLRQIFVLIFGIGISSEPSKFSELWGNSFVPVVSAAILVCTAELHRMVLLISFARRLDARAAVFFTAVLLSLPALLTKSWFISSLLCSTVMALLYIRHETLFAPLLASFIIILLQHLVIFWVEQTKIEIYSLAFIAKYLWLFIAGAVVSLVPVLNFIVRAWPPADWGKETADRVKGKSA